MDIFITHHAEARAKERFSWNKQTTLKMAYKAFTEGKDVSKAKGHLKKYIALQYNKEQKEANQIRIHGQIIYLFKDNLLITLFMIPNNLKKLAAL